MRRKRPAQPATPTALPEAASSTAAARSAPRRARFPRVLRITRGGDFDRVMKRGVRVVDTRLSVWGLPTDRPYTRLGLTVGRKHGGAVARNRIKRVLREAFRLCREDLPGGLDLVCAPRTGWQVERDACTESLRELAKRIAARVGSAPRP